MEKREFKIRINTSEFYLFETLPQLQAILKVVRESQAQLWDISIFDGNSGKQLTQFAEHWNEAGSNKMPDFICKELHSFSAKLSVQES